VIAKEKAELVLQFMRLLKDPKGGSFTKRQTIQWLPWQEKFFTDIFATLNENGTRQYREAFVEIPRKNGKSTMIAACVVYQLFMSPEYGQEIYSAANDREQASLVFNMAASMIRANPALKLMCRIYDSTKRIVREDTESFYKALSRESATAHGLNPSFVIYDELHEAKSRDLYDVLKTGMGTRTEPLFVTITTAGSDTQGICYELYQYARQVSSGTYEDRTFYPLIFEADEDDDIWSEATWLKANPSAGAFRDLEEIREYARRAKQLPTLELSFRRLYLNQWVQALTRWMRREKWNACGNPIPYKKLIGRPCYGGLDLSSTDDFSAFVLVFPMDDGSFVVLPYFWIPDAKLRQRRKNGVMLEPWIKAGMLETTPGEVVDYNYILDRVEKLMQEYRIQEIAFDRWGAAKLRADMEIKGWTLVQFGQGFASMSAPMKELERLVVEQKVIHGNHPVLNWMAENVVARTDPAGNIKPDKEKSAEKIDGIVAMIMALDRAIRWKEQQSVYETRPVRLITF
jgi:phage terminase large subunit-like protein